MCASIVRVETVCEGMPWAPKKSMSEAGRVLNNSIYYEMTATVRQIFFIHSINLSEKQKKPS